MNIVVDTKQLTRYLDDASERQFPFAMANTLNDVAKLDQYRERERMAGIFTIRRKQWVDNNVKITQFATKRDLTAIVAIEAPGKTNRSDIIGKFEGQTEKRPFGGHKSLAVPVAVKRNKADIITGGNRPKAFNFREVHGPQHVAPLKKNVRSGILRGQLQVFEGDKKTVMIRNAQGRGVILQRVGRGKRAGMRVLFVLTPRVKLTPNLDFLETARAAATHAKDFFSARFAEAMSTAKR